MIEFPKSFFWGAATSAYQVEGNNINSDWWEWEKKVGLKEVSGQACRHYQFYEEDFYLAKALNHNAHRLSIEWSRIEPLEGKFSSEAINHYKDVISSLRKCGLEPIVTLHHFTNPIWFAESGGWQGKRSSYYFLRYAGKVAEALSDDVRYWITINEPLVYIYHSYITGLWPPQEKSLKKAIVAGNNMSLAHIESYRFIHNHYKNKGLAPVYAGIAHNLQLFAACNPSIKNKISVYLKDKFYNLYFIEKLVRQKSLDFIGVNYYTRTLVDVGKWNIYNLLLDTCKDNCANLKKNCLGWEIYPQGLYQMLMKIKKYNLPVIITENGICTNDDSERWEFIREHLKNAYFAIRDGVNILGYFYWSLMDNFEWDKGFGPRFGLVGIDYKTYKRSIRASAEKFSSVCKTGELDDASK